VLGVLLFGMITLVFIVPSVAQFHITSKESRCLSNLARIGFANSVYANMDASDPAIPIHRLYYLQCGWGHEGLCPSPSFIGAYEWGGKSGLGFPGFVEYPNELGSRYGTVAGFGPSTRPLNQVLYKAHFADAYAGPTFDRIQAEIDTRLVLDINTCPADTGYTGIHYPFFRDSQLSSYDSFGTSYAANVLWVTDADSGEMQSISPYLHKYSAIPNPARTIGYYENNGRFAWSAQPTPTGCEVLGEGVAGTVHGWHGRDWTFNAAFMDGHVGRNYMHGQTLENVYFADPALRDQYGCDVVRGQGWQLDTLPLEPVPTGLEWSGEGRAAWEWGVE